MSYIEQRKGKAPPDWDGIIDMSKLGG